MKKNVVIVGAGPAGIFTALEMLNKGSKKSIMILAILQKDFPEQALFPTASSH